MDSSAIDWASIASSIATGVAAIVGIGGTAFLAKRASKDAKYSLEAAQADAKASREATSGDLLASLSAAAAQLTISIDAEDRRAYIAEKRRIYASVLVIFQEVINAATAYRVARSENEENSVARQDAVTRQTKAQESMFGTFGELLLIAPRSVAGNAVALQNVLVQFMVASHKGAPFDEPSAQAVGAVREVLLRSMRDDLGEPTGTSPVSAEVRT